METTDMEITNKEMLQESPWPDIPDEIIREILSRLPVKSLLRFKCVCRSWWSLISSSNFRLNTTGKERAIFYGKGNNFYSVDSELLVEKIPNPLEKIIDSPNQDYIFLGYCNGLSLFSFSASIYLWNPSTRSCRGVLRLDLLADENYAVKASGICFDDSNDDYKVIIALGQRIEGDGKFALIATLRSKKWSVINFPYKMFSALSGPVVNGNLHWVIKETKGKPDFIVYFDAKTSRFDKLPMLDYHVGDSSDIFGLGVLDGCLTMSRFGNIGDPEQTNEILIMQEYGVKESWTTLFSLPLKVLHGVGWLSWLPPLFYTKTSKEVLLTNGVHVSAFNLKEKSFRDINSSNRPAILNCHMYVERLAAVPEQHPDENLEELADS